MSYLFFSILTLIIGFLIVQKHQRGNLSNLTECAICNKLFKESEIFVVDDYPFCLEHLHVYKNNEWSILHVARSNPNDVENGVKLYEYKLKLFNQQGIPSIIKASYSIEDGEIITILNLYVPPTYLNSLIKKDPH